MGKRIISIIATSVFVVGCQSVPQEQKTVETVETTVYVERQSPDPKVVVIKEEKIVTPAKPQKTLSVLQISDGKGCPSRDPNSYGVFLKSERAQNGLFCYYD